MMVTSTVSNRRLRGGARRRDGVSLVELLIAMSIMTVISAMIVMGWAAAQRSWAYSRNSAEARDLARVGLSRMTREIRDAEVPSNAYLASTGLPLSSPSIVRSRQMWIAFFTTFNQPGSMPDVKPRLVVYCAYSADGQLWRYADLNGDGQNGTNGSWADAIDDLTSHGVTSASAEAVQTTTWEGRQKVVDHVVNWGNPDPNVPGSTFTDVFRYSCWGTSGVLNQDSPVTGDQNRSGIVGVQIHLLVDLNPAHSPAYIDLMTTAQMRNQRQS